MGGRAGGGAGAGRGGAGGAFASTYGTSGTFRLYGSEYGTKGGLGQTYGIAVLGNKKMGAEWFNSAAAANEFAAKLSQNGFKQFGKIKSFTQAYQTLHGLTTERPKILK